MTERTPDRDRAIFDADQLLEKILETQPNLFQQSTGTLTGTNHAAAIRALRDGLIAMYLAEPTAPSA